MANLALSVLAYLIVALPLATLVGRQLRSESHEAPGAHHHPRSWGTRSVPTQEDRPHSVVREASEGGEPGARGASLAPPSRRRA